MNTRVGLIDCLAARCEGLAEMAISQFSDLNDQWLDGLEFCSRVYRLYESIRSEPDGASRFRRRPSRLEKKLLEELMPICSYLQFSYRAGRYISVRWIDGSQPWDAELLQRGAYVSENQYPSSAFLEVTCTMHPNEYLARELLDSGGVAFGSAGIRRLRDGTIESVPVPFRGSDFIESYTTILERRIVAKSKHIYPAETTLVIQCTLNTVYTLEEWNQLVNSVRGVVSTAPFREVYLYDRLGQHSASLFRDTKREST